jgi:hypothetical protein
MKPAWETDLEAEEQDPRIQAILDCLFVLGIVSICVAALAFVLGLLWPHIERWL